MSEIENLGGVLREIRSAVSGDEATASLVEEMVAKVPEVPAGPSVDEALTAMARSRPPPELAYERPLVLAALVKVRPERFGYGGSDRHRVVGALQPVTPDGSRGRGEAMHTLLCEGVDWGEKPREMRGSLIRTALADRFLDVAIDGRTATVRSPTGDVRARLVRSATVFGVRRKDLHPLLDPKRWGELSGGRITLTLSDEGELTVGGESGDAEKTITYTDYIETFRVSERLELTPLLRFVRRPKSDERTDAPDWLEYRLAGEQSPGEIVTVDQGSIVVHETGDGVRVETTKRVRLTPPFDAPSLALQAEVLGYPDAFEQMVREAVHLAAKQAA